MENKKLKYITAICFVALAVLYTFFDGYFRLWNLLSVIGCIFIVIALLTSVPVLSAVGFAVWVINMLIICIDNFNAIIKGYLSLDTLLIMIIGIVSPVLLMIASIQTKYAITYGFVAGILVIVRFVINLIGSKASGYNLIISYVLDELFLVVGGILLGFTYKKLSERVAINKVVTVQNSDTITQKSFEDSNAEKLMHLKSFLDKGIITQEEFDEKKKQLLGL